MGSWLPGRVDREEDCLKGLMFTKCRLSLSPAGGGSATINVSLRTGVEITLPVVSYPPQIGDAKNFGNPAPACGGQGRPWYVGVSRRFRIMIFLYSFVVPTVDKLVIYLPAGYCVNSKNNGHVAQKRKGIFDQD